MGIIFHPKASQIKKILDAREIQKLYHFTSIDNLPIIAKCGGLWSKDRLERKGLLDKVVTGGNDISLSLDKSLGNWDKVHLYFCPNTPMAYRVQQNPEGRDPQSAHICYLIIDPIVALWNGVFFTDTNATRKQDGHRRERGLRGLDLVDFSIIRNTLSKGPRPWDQTWHRNIQAECLIPNEVPLKFIKSISFISNASKKESERLWRSEPHPPFEVNEALFHRGFPHVRDAILSSEEINKDNVESGNFSDVKEFILGRDSEITMLVNLKAVPGLETETIWRGTNEKEISKDLMEFDKESDYWHWPSIKIEEFNTGHYAVEYYIEKTRWIKIVFILRR